MPERKDKHANIRLFRSYAQLLAMSYDLRKQMLGEQPLASQTTHLPSVWEAAVQTHVAPEQAQANSR